MYSYNALSTANSATLNNTAAYIDDGSGSYFGYFQLPFSSTAGTTSTISLSSCQIYTVTSTTTFSLYVTAGFSAGSVATAGSQFSFRFVRIA